MVIMRILCRGVALLFVAFLICGSAQAALTPVDSPAQEEMKSESEESQTPLMRAIRDTDTRVFQSLLDQANVNASDDQGWTALMVAISVGEPAFVKALLKKGADVNAQSKDGLTPLILAARLMISANKADVEIARMLIERGADVNAIGKDSVTALMSAASRGRFKLVKLLLEKGAKINEEDKQHATALTYAISGKHKEMVEYLKSAGATGPDPAPEPKPTSITSIDQRPVPLNNPAPEYTELARQDKIEGNVIAHVLVGSDGNVKKVRVTKGLPDGLTDQAIRAAYALKFKPALKAGQPVAFWQSVIIEFHLRR